MRILHLDTGREMRGGQHQALLLHKSLAAHGCEQTLLAGPAIRAAHDFEATTWSSIRHHADRCDLIHAHDARAHTLALIHGRSKPVVVARRVAFPIGRGPASNWKYRKAAHFIAISQHVAGILASGGVPSDKVSVVHDAAPDQNVFLCHDPSESASAPGRRGDFVVVTPNFKDPLKGREIALEACRRSGVEVITSDNLARDIPRASLLVVHLEVRGARIGHLARDVGWPAGHRQQCRRHPGSGRGWGHGTLGRKRCRFHHCGDRSAAHRQRDERTHVNCRP